MSNNILRHPRLTFFGHWARGAATPLAAATLLALPAVAQMSGPTPAARIDTQTPTSARNAAPASGRLAPELLEAVREHRGLAAQSEAVRTRSHLIPRPGGRLLVSIKSPVTSEVAAKIQQAGGVIVNSFPLKQIIRAEIPPASLEPVADLAGVTGIEPAYFCDDAHTATNVPAAFGPAASGTQPRGSQ